jgi:orotidine-5'-phosphate decarboxylase
LPALAGTISYIKTHYPAIPIILDAKRGDIGATNAGYVRAIFDLLGVDAATVHPYFGQEALRPFLERRDKGIIVMASNSNAGAAEFQDEVLQRTGEPLYQYVARTVAEEWNTAGNCLVTVGATFPEKVGHVRSVVGDMPLLVLGVGTQGGDLAATVRHGRDSRGWGMIINASRSVLYASNGHDYQQAARQAAVALDRGIEAALRGS